MRSWALCVFFGSVRLTAHRRRRVCCVAASRRVWPCTGRWRQGSSSSCSTEAGDAHTRACPRSNFPRRPIKRPALRSRVSSCPRTGIVSARWAASLPRACRHVARRLAFVAVSAAGVVGRRLDPATGDRGRDGSLARFAFVFHAELPLAGAQGPRNNLRRGSRSPATAALATSREPRCLASSTTMCSLTRRASAPGWVRRRVGRRG